MNRLTTELSEVGDGLVLFDTSLAAFVDGVLTSLRRWTDEPVPMSATSTAMRITWAARAAIYGRRRKRERSLMAPFSV